MKYDYVGHAPGNIIEMDSRRWKS